MKRILVVLGFLLVAAVGFLLFETRIERRRLEEQLAMTRAENERARKELAEMSKSAAGNADELNRLRANQTEALKLRAEVSKLKQGLADAKQATAAAERRAGGSSATNTTVDTLKVEALPEDNPEVSVHKTEVIQTRMAPNSAILAGGWKGESGRRIFVLLRAERDPQANGADMISVMSNWLEVSDDTARKMRLPEIDASGGQTAMLADFSIKQFQEELGRSENVDFLSAPNVTTLAGRQARISVTESRETSAGPVEFGPKVDVLPNLAEDGSTLEVGFRAAIVEQRKR